MFEGINAIAKQMIDKKETIESSNNSCNNGLGQVRSLDASVSVPFRWILLHQSQENKNEVGAQPAKITQKEGSITHSKNRVVHQSKHKTTYQSTDRTPKII